MRNIFPAETPTTPDLSFLDYQAEYQASRSNHQSNIISISELYSLDRITHHLPIPAYDTESESCYIQPTVDESIQTCTQLELFHLAVMAAAVEITKGRLHPKDRYCDREGRFLGLEQLKEVELIRYKSNLLNNTLYHYLKQAHGHLNKVMEVDNLHLTNQSLFHLYRDCLWAAYHLLSVFYDDDVGQFMVKSMLTTLLNQKTPHTMQRAVCERRGRRNFDRYLEGLPK